MAASAFAFDNGSPYPPLELPPPGVEPIWWPINAAQQAALNSRAELLLMGGQSGGGKLMDVDELIPTPSGFVRNGDLVDGTIVFGQDGQQYPVLKAHPTEDIEAFRVCFDDGTSTLVHGGHLWHTFTKRDRERIQAQTPEFRARRKERRPVRGKGLKPWLAERNLKAADDNLRPVTGAVRTTEEICKTLRVGCAAWINHAVRIADPICLPRQDLPLDPYVLGMWLGDGDEADGMITIGLEDQEEALENLRTHGADFHALSDPIRFLCYGMRVKLSNIGVLGNKHVPDQYLWASAEQRLQLLRGLMDSDGCCNQDGQCEFTSVRINLAQAVYHLAASLGMKPTLKTGRAKLYEKDCGAKYTVKWTGMLECFHLSRKRLRLPKSSRRTQGYRYILSVEPVGPRKMRCITTANPSGLYLFGRNFNVTHNTQFLAADAMQEYKNPALSALLLRRTLEEMQELEDIQKKMYEPYGAQWKKKRWRFPSGASIRPGYLAHDNHLRRYQGNPYSWLGVDESGQHPENRIRFLIGWLAAPEHARLRVRCRLTSNPGDVGHGWQMKVFLRNRCPVHNPATFADDRPFETSVWPGRVYRGASWTDDSPVMKTTSFIPARLADNPLYGPTKRASLMSQSKAVQMQMLYGCWCNAAGLYFDFMRPEMVVPYATIGDAWWWMHFLAIDYGFGNSAASAGMYAINPNGKVFKTRERVERRMYARKFALALCRDGFEAMDFPKQTPSTHWLTKLKPRDPERPRIAFCVMDHAMDQRKGTGKSVYKVISEVMGEHGVGCLKAPHDPMGNAQVMYNGLANSGLVLTRDGNEMPLSYRSLSSRVVDARKAVKKIHGAWEDDVYDETAYGYNCWRANSEKPARTALEEKLQKMRDEGMDDTTIARVAWKEELAIREAERKAEGGVVLGRRRLKGKR